MKNDYKIGGYLMHSAKGTSWEKVGHKYIYKRKNKNGKWVYYYSNAITITTDDEGNVEKQYGIQAGSDVDRAVENQTIEEYDAALKKYGTVRGTSPKVDIFDTSSRDEKEKERKENIDEFFDKLQRRR